MTPKFYDDTDPKAEAVHIELLRRATPERRLALCLNLSDTVRRLARDAIRRANPAASEDELKVIFARVHYGDALAEGVRAALQERARHA